MVDRVLFSSKSGEYETPDDLFAEFNVEFKFNLDPAASNENAKCGHYFTKADDGLARAWSLTSAQAIVNHAPARIWCNPPYGREVGKWVKKAHDEFNCGNAELVVMLLPARTDTAYFHDYIYNKTEVRFLRGRLKFKGTEHPAPFPSMIVIWKKQSVIRKAKALFRGGK